MKIIINVITNFVNGISTPTFFPIIARLHPTLHIQSAIMLTWATN